MGGPIAPGGATVDGLPRGHALTRGHAPHREQRERERRRRRLRRGEDRHAQGDQPRVRVVLFRRRRRRGYGQVEEAFKVVCPSAALTALLVTCRLQSAECRVLIEFNNIYTSL